MRSGFGAREVPSQQKPDLNYLVGVQNSSACALPIQSRSSRIAAILGLQYNRPFHRDTVFLILLVLGPLTWLSMLGFFPYPLPARPAIGLLGVLSIMLWQPLFEELLFRGIVQGHLLPSVVRHKSWCGVSISNLMASLLFTLAHLASHSALWSLLVFVPSLCFGLVRDRFGSVYPSIALHAFYNTGYFLLTGGITLQNIR